MGERIDSAMSRFRPFGARLGLLQLLRFAPEVHEVEEVEGPPVSFIHFRHIVTFVTPRGFNPSPQWIS